MKPEKFQSSVCVLELELFAISDKLMKLFSNKTFISRQTFLTIFIFKAFMHGNFVLLNPFYFLISALVKINVHDDNTCNVFDNDNNKVQQFSSRKKERYHKKKI